MQWLNEPPTWDQDGTDLTVTTGPRTDFWRKTHSGVVADNGHFAYQELTGDFSAQLTVSGTYTDLYDQAGLMLRIDAENWLKCGIEYIEGRQFVSAVVTREMSDWSVVPVSAPPASLALRVVRHGTTVEVYYTLPGAREELLRQASLPVAQTIQVGPMCASPVGDGFVVRFTGFEVREGVSENV